MMIAKTLIGTGILALALAAPAAAADKVPVKLKVKDCDGCQVMATWSKTGKVTGKFKSRTKVPRGTTDTLKYKVPKGYYLHFTATSPRAEVNAATVMVTRFVGAAKGAMLTPETVAGLNNGASYCMKAKKMTVKAQAALMSDAGSTLLAFWANPQRKAMGTKLNDGISGVYGTQNTLPCKGKYY